VITSDDQSMKGFARLPEHLQRWPGLYVRDGGQIVEASDRDIAVARSYPWFQDKGPITDGRRITVLTENTTYRVGDEIRIIHVVEFTEPGYQAYIMGPKLICGEYINGELVSEPVSAGDPLVPMEYSGVTLPSPVVDYNYDITTYRFNEAGRKLIDWRLGDLRSNVLSIEIVL
jgi:hypothetical protein